MEMFVTGKSCAGCFLRWLSAAAAEEAGRRRTPDARPDGGGVDPDAQAEQLERSFGPEWKW
jgi:hypothetical protein